MHASRLFILPSGPVNAIHYTLEKNSEIHTMSMEFAITSLNPQYIIHTVSILYLQYVNCNTYENWISTLFPYIVTIVRI